MRTRPKPLDCGHCGRRIGAGTTHYVLVELDPARVHCGRCLGRAAHDAAYPRCPFGWHDCYDHGLTSGSRAGVRWYLTQADGREPSPPKETRVR